MMLLSVTRLRAGYGHTDVLRDVCLTVERNQIVALVGHNGAGKTTLLRAISGMIPVREGNVSLHGFRLDGCRAEEIANRGLRHVPEGRRLFAGLTVRDNLLLGCWRGDTATRSAGLDKALELFPQLRGRLRQVAGNLSGGEQQMCAIARGLMGNPAVLMIDELSLGLAPNTVEELLARLPDIAAAGTSILVVEQDIDTALAFADHAYVLERGRMVWDGSAGRLLTDPVIRPARRGAVRP